MPTTRSLRIPPHLNDIATLPCETIMFQKSQIRTYSTEERCFEDILRIRLFNTDHERQVKREE